jgi:hypothetical protein
MAGDNGHQETVTHAEKRRAGVPGASKEGFVWLLLATMSVS